MTLQADEFMDRRSPGPQGDSRPLVEVNGVTMVFPAAQGPLTAVEDVSFSIHAGEFVSVIGPSGCGKSTLLRLIADIFPPTRGTVRVAGQPPAGARKAHLIGLMFQEPVLLPWLTIRDNVELATEITGVAHTHDPRWILEFVGLKGRERDYPNQLSIGMQQRAALARSLATNPTLLLMDEPFAALDELTRDRMGEWLVSIWEETRKTVIFVTHSIAEAVYLSDRVIVFGTQPGHVKTEVPVPLPRPRAQAVKESLAFFELVRTLREYLHPAPQQVRQ